MIAAERAHVPVRKLCRWFGVSPSGFYASQIRSESKWAQDDRRLKVLMHASFTGGRGYYGSPRIHDDFVAWGGHVSRKRIIRLIQADGLKARVRKRYNITTDSNHDQPIAANLLQQDFTAERPNQRWVGDTSELRIGEHGEPTSRVLTAYSITCRMSRRGNCYDAVVEAFFSTVKSEIGEWFTSHGEAKMALFDYIEVFYNQRRRHSTLGRISPARFERGAAA